MGTQSGSDYGSSLEVLGETIIAGFVATIFLIPLSLLISSLTTRKSYAAIGTFTVFFILSIIGAIFREFNNDANWGLMNPEVLLSTFFDVLYGFGINSNIDAGIFSVMFSGFIIIPLALLYLRVYMKAVGK